MSNRATQVVRRVLADGPSTARSTQVVRRALVAEGANLRTTQVVRRMLAESLPNLRATQVVRRALAAGLPCVTKRSQLWLIERRDGERFAYTSHNEDIVFRGITFKACNSLQPTASSAKAELGISGDQSLEGIISDDGISEADLYGGLFDDAFVQVFLVSWGEVASPVRLIAGWTGEIEHGPKGMTMQVLGPSHRLDQNAITTSITAACRWVFGDARCGIDREVLRVSGSVAAAGDRGRFEATFDSGDLNQYFVNGLLRWTSGQNAGQECEVKEVDFGSGSVITLWKLTGRRVEAGDTFEMLPGCDKAKDSPNGCSGYANIINFGGFPGVPGNDAMTDAPPAKL